MVKSMQRPFIETALRELGEEAGVSCSSELIPLGYFFSSVGFTDECCHLFLARDVIPRAEGFDHDEHEAIVEVREFSESELTAIDRFWRNCRFEYSGHLCQIESAEIDLNELAPLF